MSSVTSVTKDQKKAWSFYGTPQKYNDCAVGVVRYVIGWMSDQMVRMKWRVNINGSDEWTLKLDDNITVTSNPKQSETGEPDHPANASRTVLEYIGWNDATIRQVTINLFVAGELNYIYRDEKWQVISVIDPYRERKLSEAKFNIRGLWPHPADPNSADAPLFAVLSDLEDLVALTRQMRMQSANRVGMRGIVGISDSFHMEGSTDDTFYEDFKAALSRPMDDTDDVAPVIIRGSSDQVKPDGRGMGGLSWVIPDFPYDATIDKRVQSSIERLAYGLPIPPEILLGMQAQSRATAFQVENNAYRGHIEPAAWTVAQIPQDILSARLDVDKVEVIPDPTEILARRHSVEDVKEAYDRGLVSPSYTREVLGIPEAAAPTEEDIEYMKTISRRQRNVRDESEKQDEDLLTAAATLPTDDTDNDSERESVDDAALSARLERIDLVLLSELVAATEQALTKARERIGAAVRSSKHLKAQIPDNLSNEEIALQLGHSVLGELGINLSNPFESVLIWWSKRATKARKDVEDILRIVGTESEFTLNGLEESVQKLETVLNEHLFESTVDVQILREVMDLAGN